MPCIRSMSSRCVNGTFSSVAPAPMVSVAIELLWALTCCKPAISHIDFIPQLDTLRVMEYMQGKLLASINNRVQLYGWTQREAGARELAAECGHSGHVCALFVETRGDFILVGTALCLWRDTSDCHRCMCPMHSMTPSASPPQGALAGQCVASLQHIALASSQVTS